MSEFDLLIVEDEPVVVQATRKVLAPEGLGIDSVADGGAAVERLGRESYRAILLDLMLPGVAGLELLETIVARRPAVPVIVTTGYATPQKAVAVFRAGAFDFLPKPFDAEELLAIVRRCLRRPGPERNLAPDVLGTPGGAVHRLGDHSWARLEADGLAILGVTDGFAASIDSSLGVTLPGPGDETVQGMAFAFVESPGAEVHRIWAPLSGRVVGGNETLEADPGRVRRDPLGGGWLTRIAPSSLQEELNELTVR